MSAQSLQTEGKLLKDIIADVGPDGFLKVEDRNGAVSATVG